MTEYFTKDSDGNFKEFTEPLHTQADLDKVVKDRAERIAKQNYSDYDDLKAKASKLDTVESEFTTKLKEKDDTIESLNGKVKTTELAVDKIKLINEFKLSDDLADFVDAPTVEEMRTRAEKLSKGIKPGKVEVDKDGKPKGGGGGEQSDSKSLAKSLFGGKSDD